MDRADGLPTGFPSIQDMLKTPMDASLSLCARHPKLPFSACVETDQSGGFDGFSVCVGKRPGEACANFDKDVKFK